MSLIKINKTSLFLSIEYSTFKSISISFTDIKELISSKASGIITIIKSRNNSVELYYLDVEDPDNIGNSFATIETLWIYIMGIINNQTLHNFIFMDGNNFIFMDGNNFIQTS